LSNASGRCLRRRRSQSWTLPLDVTVPMSEY
jgi:hypothetical protein